MATTSKLLLALALMLITMVASIAGVVGYQERLSAQANAEAYQKASLQVCVQTGGVPILDYDRLQLLDCKFPNILPHAVEVK